MCTKQDVFIDAVDLAIDQLKNDLKSTLCKLFTNDKTGKIAHLLSHIVLAYKLHNGKVSFASILEVDFVNNALCSLHNDSDGIHLIMDKPLIIEQMDFGNNHDDLEFMCKKNLFYGTTIHDCIIEFTLGKIRPDSMNSEFLINYPWWNEPQAVQLKNNINYFKYIERLMNGLPVYKISLESFIAKLD
ncbi:hypothetical protein C1646_751219 [Rhizophagus diaphanus]|nr:hypothetical protein C1646_751219 [Rhizophagus diaphanus] [Rhizophagus sp. MUCL 43196]